MSIFTKEVTKEVEVVKEKLVVLGENIRTVFRLSDGIQYRGLGILYPPHKEWHGKYFDTADAAFAASEGQGTVSQHKVVVTDQEELYLLQVSALIKVEK